MVFTFHFCINCDLSLFKFSSIKQTKCKLQQRDGKGGGRVRRRRGSGIKLL